MNISCPEFEDQRLIPDKYTCFGKDISPPLIISKIPKEAKSLVIVLEDPDALSGAPWVHWIVFNIPVPKIVSTSEKPKAIMLKEGTVHGDQGTNDFGVVGYKGPCPPSGVHRYYFEVFALDTKIELRSAAKKVSLELAMDGHILDRAEIMGLFADNSGDD